MNTIKALTERLSHPALQSMACTLGSYNFNDLRQIYLLHNLRITPIDQDAGKWLEQKIVRGDQPRRYRNDLKICISPERWADILRTVRYDDLPMLTLGSPISRKESREAITHLVSAFILYLNDKPFIEELKRTDWGALNYEQKSIMTLLGYLIKQREFSSFCQQIQQDWLFYLFYDEHIVKKMRLEQGLDTDIVDHLFLNNELIDSSVHDIITDQQLYYVELPATGKVDQILPRLRPGENKQQLVQSIKYLQDGEPAKAYSLLSAILKVDKALIFADALTNFAYALAIGLTNSTQAIKAGEKLMKDKKIINDSRCYAMMLVLHHFIRSDAAEFYKIYPITTCTNRMSWILANVFLRHYQILDKEPVAVTDYEQLIRLATSMMPKVKRMEPWERVIDQIMKLNGDTGGTAGKKKRPQHLDIERVAYIVNLHSYNVQPKLQKSKDGGITWTKGRNIALKNFGQETGLTPLDRQIAAMVESYSYGWYGQTSYELCGERVIAALAGCDRVFSEHTEQRIDIVAEPLQLQVQPKGDGYSVRSNVNLEQVSASGYSITEEGNKQVTVTQVTRDQKRTLELLRSVGIFPKESKRQLTQLLQSLSSEFTVMSPLLKNATDLKRVESSSLIAVQIAPAEGQQFSISLAVKPFGNKPPYQKPGKGMEILSVNIDGELMQTERDLKAEKQNLELIEQILGVDHQDYDDRWYLDTAQCLALLEQVRQHPEAAYVEWPQGIRMRVVRPMITPDQLRLKISSAGQWFEVEGDVSIGNKEKIKMAELLERLRSAEGNFIRLEGDEFIALSETLRRQLQALDKMLMGRSSKQLKIATMNGLQLADIEELGAQVKADEAFRNLIRRIREAATQQYPLPTNIHAELRPYQQEGFQWMSRLAHWGAGACLADDMGLGKTLQSITLMQSRAALGPQLVLMPTSVLLNWQQELRRFAPALTVKVLNQQSADRQKIVGEAEAGDVVLSTYGLLVTEEELLSSRTWTTIVLDEAHTIKNRDTQTSKGAMNLKGDFRLMLTGTPLQNHLSEIWNLFQFADPGLLGSFQQFTDRFILPIEKEHNQERQRLLRHILSPFLLRRTKEDVLNELPEKTEITLRIELSKDEQALYDNLRQQAIANLEEGSKSALQTLAEITRLRQAACHPRLINEKLNIPSSKTQAFLELVGNLRQSGHRALVFSQFTSHLALVRKELDQQQVPYLYLDGSTSAQERNRLVKLFQTGDTPLFLISLKAGGLGLNLTAADFVIHLDPWWNPAIEDQASDRAHRIGQERPVTVYRLIAAGTIEEKIIRLHQNKRSMADALLQDADMFSQISADDVIRLLRESVDAIQ